MKKVFFLSAAVLFASHSVATENSLEESKLFLQSKDVFIYDIGYGGNGCPDGTVDAVISQDKSTVKVFFDQYFADSAEANSGRDRKSCNVGISVGVPSGKKVALTALDYIGHVDLGTGAYGELLADYFFAGEATSHQFEKQWINPDGPIGEDFYLEDSIPADDVVWSGCGEDVIVRVNTSLKAYEGSNQEPAYIALDSVESKASLLYGLQWVDCDE